MTQTHRRIILGEAVPASEKLVSIFESHTDIIVKDRRDTLYGHKLCLATGASGLITDFHVEKGNPADSTLAVSMIERHMERYGRAPKQACFDGGFASHANLEELKKRDVDDVVFAKAKAPHRRRDGRQRKDVPFTPQLPRGDRSDDLLPQAVRRLGALCVAVPALVH